MDLPVYNVSTDNTQIYFCTFLEILFHPLFYKNVIFILRYFIFTKKSVLYLNLRCQVLAKKELTSLSFRDKLRPVNARKRNSRMMKAFRELLVGAKQ